MDYLLDGGDIHKYDSIQSKLVYGKHRKCKFSIIIPTYKRIGLLKEAIQSALNQKYKDFEIVVVDNNDDDEEIAQKVADLIIGFKSDKILYYRNEKNIGIYGNTLRAAQLARGDYVAILDDDDLLNPSYLQIINAFIEKYNYYGVIGTVPCEFRNKNYKEYKVRGAVGAYKITQIEYFFGCVVTSPGMCFPKKIINEIYNSYEELLMGDQIIQYKALEKYGLYFIDFPLALYRIQDNATRKDDVLQDMIVDMCYFKKQIAQRNFFLRIYMRFFGNEYLSWYVNDTLSFWKKRSIKNTIVHKLHIENINKWSLKYQINNHFIYFIRGFYGTMRGRKKDVVRRGVDY